MIFWQKQKKTLIFEKNYHRMMNIPDCLFETDNDLEIPLLRLDRQPKVCEIPFVCYGEQARSIDMNGHGTLHFYTEDYRYNTIYEKPQQIIAHNPSNIVEPNFSCYQDMPVAFALQAIYKKRWIARMMQEKGINVFVDLNVASKFYKLNLLGIPQGWTAFCTRGYSDRLHYLEFEYELARSIAAENADEILFVIYNGGDKCRQFAKEHRCIYVSPIVDIKKRKRKLEAKNKIEQSVAFLSPEWDNTHLIEQAISKAEIEQVTNYQKRIE